jgi:cytoskeletal protein RodZ
MSSVGSYLRELRERRGVSLEEISRVTHVTRSYLDALERGDFGKLPAPVFVRGFIRAYCQVLREPAEEALALYDDRPPETSGPPREVSGRVASRDTTPRSTVMVSVVLLVVLGAALVAVTLALRSGREGSGPRTAAQPAETSSRAAATADTPPASRPGGAPAETGVPPTTRSPEGAATPAPASAGSDAAVSRGPSTTARDEATATTKAPAAQQPTAPPAVPGATQDAARLLASATSPYRLIARTSEATWVRIRTEDGRQLSEETIPAGQVREWVSNRRFDVTIGNAGGVRLELNGRALPVLGASRDVVRLALPPEAP